MLPSHKYSNVISAALQAKLLCGPTSLVETGRKTSYHLYFGGSTNMVGQQSLFAKCLRIYLRLYCVPRGGHSLRTPQTGFMLTDIAGWPVTQ